MDIFTGPQLLLQRDDVNQCNGQLFQLGYAVYGYVRCVYYRGIKYGLRKEKSWNDFPLKHPSRPLPWTNWSSRPAITEPTFSSKGPKLVQLWRGRLKGRKNWSKFWLWSSTLPGFDKPHWVQGRHASWQTTSWIIIKCKASDGEEYSCWLAFIVCPHYACLNCQAKIPCYSCSWMPHVAGPSAFTGGFIG